MNKFDVQTGLQNDEVVNVVVEHGFVVECMKRMADVIRERAPDQLSLLADARYFIERAPEIERACDAAWDRAA